MANEQNRDPANEQTDISKAQSTQQPSDEAGQHPEAGTEIRQTPAGAGPDEGLQGDTATQQRTDVEGATLRSAQQNQAESGFIGSQSGADASSELVEEQHFAKDDQGAPEGK